MIVVKDLIYQYESTEMDTLKSISLSLKEGEIIGLLGHNGAGKTTLLECLSGIRKIKGGDIHIDNIDANPYKNISYIPNDLYLYNMLTIQETLIFMGRLYSLSTKDILGKVEPLLKLFSLEEKRNEYIKNLSYGMKQKVALILGIIDSPKYVLLDEPMNGYDALSTKTTKDFLLNYSKNNSAGILLSSHRLDIVEDICDRVYVINQGNVIFEGLVSTLKNDRSFEEALIGIVQGEDINEEK
ncbi:ABC transporter ATP-binding protein [Bacillus cereus]|uniref:ABC transporter ATP-binding protein n=1 Tax=Bacillus cereus TaxID=1396 RepID=UPI0034D42288